jgi:quinol monooxygenase YgiN
MDEPIVVVAEVKAKPGKEDALRARLLGLIEPTRAEEGCIQYNLHEAAGEPGRLLFYEIWRSKPDLDQHLATPYLQDLFAAIPELVEGDPRIVIYRRIA